MSSHHDSPSTYVTSMSEGGAGVGGSGGRSAALHTRHVCVKPPQEFLKLSQQIFKTKSLCLLGVFFSLY